MTPSGKISEAMVEAFAAEFYSIRTPVKWSESQREDIRRALTAALSVPTPGTGGAEDELAKLVEYFRGEGYGRFGWEGDIEGRSPAETAITAMRKLASTPQAGGLGVVKALEWMNVAALSGGRKLVAMDPFGNEFARIDLRDQGDNEINRLQADAQARYKTAILSALSSSPVGEMDGPEEIEIDRLRLAAFKTNSNEDKAAYYLAVSKWFQDRHNRRLASPQGVR